MDTIELDNIITTAGPQKIAKLANEIDCLAGAPLDKLGFGLCFHIKDLTHDLELVRVIPSYELVKLYAKDWPWFSGDEDFPVPHETSSAVDSFYSEADLWDDQTQYGHLRRQLARYVSARLLKDCERLHAQ